MRRFAYAAAVIVSSCSICFAESPLTDAQIRAALVQADIEAYSGNCPCPYSVDSRGRRCGKRSAYDRPGGEEPLCYPGNITAEMIADFRRNGR